MFKVIAKQDWVRILLWTRCIKV